MKKFIIILCAIFSLFCFSGCKKEETLKADDFICFSTQITTQGQVVQSLNFSVNLNKIKSFSSSQKEQTIFLSNLIDKINEKRNNYLFNYAIIYLENPKEEYKINNGVYLSNVTYNSNNDTIGFFINFSSINTFNYYHKIDGKNEEKNSNIFINKNLSSSQFLFSNNIEDETQTVGEKFRRDYLAASEGLSFHDLLEKEYNPCFIYSYSLPSRKLHSNSNFKAKDSGVYYHIWKVDYQNLDKENTVKVWNYDINYLAWILTLFGVDLVIILFGLVLCKLKKRKSHQTS